MAKDWFLKFIVLPAVVLCAVGSVDLARDYVTAVFRGGGAVAGIVVESPDDLKAGFEEGRGAAGGTASNPAQ